MQPKIRISSSIANFEEKLLKRTGAEEYNFPRDIFKPAIFVGAYHFFDIIRYFLHTGGKKLFFCGSDILHLNRFYSILLRRGVHYCENDVERKALLSKGIKATILPMIFTDFKSEDCFVPVTDKIHIYLTAHKGREKEYGVTYIERELSRKCPDVIFHIYGINRPCRGNVIYHGKVEEHQFDQEIKSYHGALRLNVFDGFAETLAKSALLMQYPISFIKYPFIDSYETEQELIALLNDLKNKKISNENRMYWRDTLERNLSLFTGGRHESHS